MKTTKVLLLSSLAIVTLACTNKISGNKTKLSMAEASIFTKNSDEANSLPQSSNQMAVLGAANIGWEGKYVDEFNRTLTLSKEDGEIKFELDMADENCQEIFEGKAYLVSANKAEGGDGTEECAIILELSDYGITVTDNGCSHGARCGDASGRYKRK